VEQRLAGLSAAAAELERRLRLELLEAPVLRVGMAGWRRNPLVFLRPL
jgi:hypothetical protein